MYVCAVYACVFVVVVVAAFFMCCVNIDFISNFFFFFGLSNVRKQSRNLFRFYL